MLKNDRELMRGALYCCHVDEPSDGFFLEVRSLVCGLRAPATAPFLTQRPDPLTVRAYELV